MQRTILFGVVGFLAVMLLVWATAFARPYELHGSEITSNVPAPAINLKSAVGSEFQMNALEGKVVLLFFGFTSCMDVCPTTLADFNRVKADLGEKADQMAFVFITVDPQRDTPEASQAYAAGFDPQFIGLSGSEAELEPVWQGYGVYRKITESDGTAGYQVDHSSRVYLVDTTNRLRVTYPYGTPVEDLTADIRFLLKEK